MTSTHTVPVRRAGETGSEVDAAQYWWVFLVLGSLWLLFSLFVFRIDATTVNSISILFGCVCVAAGAVELSTALASAGGHRLIRAFVSLWFFVIGILCFVHPGDSFSALATIFAFFLFLRGVWDIAVAFATRGAELWWVGLLTGAVQVALAFWASGNFGHKAILLVVWVGLSALMAGIRQIAFAFELRSAADR